MAPSEFDRSAPARPDYNADSALQGYQARLLERTSSLSRASSLSKGAPAVGILTPNGAARRWTPSHRVGASVDSLRAKTEDRLKGLDGGSENGVKVVGSLRMPYGDSRVSNLNADDSTFKTPASPQPLQPAYRLVDQSPLHRVDGRFEGDSRRSS